MVKRGGLLGRMQRNKARKVCGALATLHAEALGLSNCTIPEGCQTTCAGLLSYWLGQATQIGLRKLLPPLLSEHSGASRGWVVHCRILNSCLAASAKASSTSQYAYRLGEVVGRVVVQCKQAGVKMHHPAALQSPYICTPLAWGMGSGAHAATHVGICLQIFHCLGSHH